jgi:protein AbiQ
VGVEKEVERKLHNFFKGRTSMSIKLQIVTIDSQYCNELRKIDYRIPDNNNSKAPRPFIGILFEVSGMKYYAPLSSPKPKHLKMHNTCDFSKIDGGKLGAINFNNMFPVIDEKSGNPVIRNVNLNSSKATTQAETDYVNLLVDQTNWIEKNKFQLISKAITLREKYINHELDQRIVDRCCDFVALENYCQIKIN